MFQKIKNNLFKWFNSELHEDLQKQWNAGTISEGQKTHFNVINYTFCLAVRVSWYYVPFYCGVLYQPVMTISAGNQSAGRKTRDSAILYKIHRELHRNRHGHGPATVRTVNHTYPVTILHWKWTRTSRVRTRRPVVETTARPTTLIQRYYRHTHYKICSLQL
jgi:hypothetical protein